MSGTLADRLPSGAVVHFDTNALIYFVEHDGRFAPVLRPVFERIEAGEVRGISSTLTLTEVLVRPLKLGRQDLAREYRSILVSSRGFRLHSVDRQTAELGASIRANHRYKVPDAIQLATATLQEAALFVTNDAALRSFPDVEVAILSDLVAS